MRPPQEMRHKTRTPKLRRRYFPSLADSLADSKGIWLTHRVVRRSHYPPRLRRSTTVCMGTLAKRAEIHVVDSHTGGEPTRVVIAGGPDLPPRALKDRPALLRERHDTFRSAVVNEPRGSDTFVGALLCPPTDPACAAGVIFFNNVGYLGMCGHGTIGVAVTLAHLGRIGPGIHRLE